MSQHRGGAEKLKEDAEGASTDIGARAGYGQQAWNGGAVAVATEQSGKGGVAAAAVVVVAENQEERDANADMAMIAYCMQLAAAEAEYAELENKQLAVDTGSAEEAVLVVESEETSVAVDATAVEETVAIVEMPKERLAELEVEGWDDVLGAVEMARQSELAVIKWTADAEVNKWMAAVEEAVEVTRGTIKEKVEKIEAEDHKVKFEFGSGAQVA